MFFPFFFLFCVGCRAACSFRGVGGGEVVLRVVGVPEGNWQLDLLCVSVCGGVFVLENVARAR
jgi:hypothetical protein